MDTTTEFPVGPPGAPTAPGNSLDSHKGRLLQRSAYARMASVEADATMGVDAQEGDRSWSRRFRGCPPR